MRGSFAVHRRRRLTCAGAALAAALASISSAALADQPSAATIESVVRAAMAKQHLRAVIVQKLVKGTLPEIPRIPAVEIMYCNPSVRKIIHDNEDRKLSDAIRAGRQEGMQDFNQSFCELVKRGMVAEHVALENSPNPEQLAMNLKGITLGQDRGGITG